MKKLFVIIALLPTLCKSQEIVVNRRMDNFWDFKLEKSVQDSVSSVNGWLNAGDDGKANINFPYLQFAIERSKREGITLLLDGSFIAENFTSTSLKDSVDIIFENNEIIHRVCWGNCQTGVDCSSMGYTGNGGTTGFELKLSLNKSDIYFLTSLPILKIRFYSAKSADTNVKGELFVKDNFKNELSSKLKALLL